MPNLDQAVNDYVTATKAQTASGLETSPDDAARTIQLEKATGVPSQVIAPNLEQFEKSTQRDMAINIVSQDPQLQTYIHSHPMAASVSSDDWGALSDFNGAARQTSGVLRALNAPWDAGLTGAISGFKSGFGPEPLISTQSIAHDFPALDPAKGPLAAVSNLLTVGGLGAGELAGRVGSGIFSALTTGAGEAARAGAEVAGMDKMNAQRFGRDIQSMSEYHMIDPGGAFVAGHELPPVGVHPGMDKLKAELNKSALDSLDEDMKAAQASATKERSPEMFQRLAEQHYGNATIGIHADAALNLYGDKPPTPDDGLLGWVPGIADKLDAAKHTGDDVQVPVADWVSRVDPAVAKLLHDDLRVWPDGITSREAGEAKVPEGAEGIKKEDVQLPAIEYPGMVDSPLAQVRGAYGLEPMFAMGDRKLSLIEAGKEAADPELFKGGEFHTLEIQDQNGVKVGDLTLTPDPATKTLHIEMVNGVAGQWANSFGPSLIRDLQSQLRGMYPEYENLSGYRVSGANAGREVTVKLDSENTYKARDILAEAFMRHISGGVEASVAPTHLFTSQQKAVAGAIHDEIAKMTGGKAKVQPTAGMKYLGTVIQGAHWTKSGMIMYDLLGDDPVGVGRHETIHYLRDQGLFNDREWATLKDAAMQENWLDRYNINTRYEGLHAEGKYEEAVAEGFREWARTAESARREFSPVAQIFQKLWDFLQNVKGRISEIFGGVPNKDALFTKISQGEIGDRASLGSADGGVKFAKEDLDNLKADGLGLDRKTFANIQKMVKERFDSDVAASLKRTEIEQARRQTKEWKDNKEALATEVEQTIRQRPDVATDLFLGSGEWKGEKIQQRFTLRSGDLTAEQRDSLPDHYTSKNGLPVDEVAKWFGYTSGDAMVESLGAYQALKGDRTPQAALKHVVDVESDRMMELKYGNLAENILSEAKDQALAKNDLNLLTEEYHAAALQAGVTAVDKDTILAKARDIVANKPIGEVDFNKQLTLVGRHYREAVRSLAAGDPASAVVALEKRTLAAHVASEMKKVEKAKASTDKLFKTLSSLPKKEGTLGRDPDYLNYMHQIMNQVGVPTRKRSPLAIQKDIDARGTGTFEEFTQTKVDNLRVMPVWDQLFDSSWRGDYATMKVSDFTALSDTMKAMDFNARDELKIIKGVEKENLEELKDSLKASVQRFGEKAYDANGNRTGWFLGTAMKAPRGFLARVVQMETLLNYWDHFDKWGDWNQSFMRPLIEGANQVDRWVKDYAADLRKLDDGADLSKTVDNPIFRNPLKEGGLGELMSFNRENLRRILLDAGNSSGHKSNLFKRAKGYGLEPDVVMGWLHQHATKEDWDWAQGVWDMWGTIKDKGDTMFRSMTGGVAPDDVVLRPIQTQFGTYKGGYFPTNDWHPLFEGTSSKLSGEDSLMQKGFTSATPMPGWAQTRTGYSAPLRNDLSNMANLMKSHLHDIAMRPGIVNAAKIGMDRGIKNAIKLHVGDQYANLIKPYLQALANRTDYMSTHQAYANGWAEHLRQNLVTTLVGLNIGTVMKHAPTAFIMSIKEVGPEHYLKGVRSMYGINDVTGDANKKFADESSLELNRRSRNWQETLYGTVADQTPGNRYESVRQEIARLSSSPVAFSDMLSARPTWLGEYYKNMDAGRPHGDAVFAADRAVRRAHGSTAATNRPQIMRDSNPWITSVYNFFNDIMNRQLETLWRAGEMTRDAKESGWPAASKAIPGIAAGIFAYAIWPAIVEQLVSPDKSNAQDSWGKKIAKGLAHTESATLPYVRDVAQYLVQGSDAALGLTGTGLKELGHVVGDLGKKQPFSVPHAQRMIHDWAGLAGMLTGMVPQAVGNVASFGYGVAEGAEHPKSPWDWVNGLRYGTAKRKP